MDLERLAHRLYTEKEVGALIQRATALHVESMGALEGSLTLEEIEHIASELGLPPEHVLLAALELDEPSNAARSFSFWGGPFVMDETRIVDGSITEEQWEQVVRELRRFTGSTGRTSEFGHTREWTSVIQDMGLIIERMLIATRAKDGRTSIQIRKYYRGGALVAYIGAFAVSATAAGIALDGGTLPDLVNLAFFCGGGAGGLAAVRAFMPLWKRRQKERLKKLTGILHRLLSTSPPQTLLNETTPARMQEHAIDEPNSAAAAALRGKRS